MRIRHALPVLAGLSCTYKAETHWDGSDPIAVDRIALATPHVLHADDPVRAGTAIGHVLFAGGYVTEDHPTGQQNVSTDAALGATAEYTRYAQDWARGPLTTALRTWGEVTPATVDAPPPTLRPLRGTYEELGRDNQPLPRFALDPSPLPADARVADADVVVVPWVVRWYTHNGGWFLGQTYGCTAGARTRLFVVVHDAADGRVLAWSDLEAKVLPGDDVNPNSAQTEDLLAQAEAALADKLAKRLPVR